MKLTILFLNNQIPVYLEKKNDKKIIPTLIAVLNTKLVNGKKTVKRFLETLDSIEIVGKEAVLYSKMELDTLSISLA